MILDALEQITQIEVGGSVVYALTNKGRIFSTNDGGKTWKEFYKPQNVDPHAININVNRKQK